MPMHARVTSITDVYLVSAVYVRHAGLPVGILFRTLISLYHMQCKTSHLPQLQCVNKNLTVLDGLH